MGIRMYFQQKAAQVLKEFIKTNMYFYNLFWSQQISIVSLKKMSSSCNDINPWLTQCLGHFSWFPLLLWTPLNRMYYKRKIYNILPLTYCLNQNVLLFFSLLSLSAPVSLSVHDSGTGTCHSSQHRAVVALDDTAKSCVYCANDPPFLPVTASGI